MTQPSESKQKIAIIGGGTFSHVRAHLALAAPAFGGTARLFYEICSDPNYKFEPTLLLTKMADASSDLVTNEDVAALVDELVADPDVGAIFFNPALVDYNGNVVSDRGYPTTSGKYAERLKTRENKHPQLALTPTDKIISRIRETRKDIFLIAFKTTSDATEDEQYFAGLRLLKENSCNLVIANDVVTRMNMIITPEEARYCVTDSRVEILRELAAMAEARSGLSYNRTNIVEGTPIPWSSDRIPETLKRVVDWCISQGAYKPIKGKSVGHFSYRESENVFLVSRRKVDHTQTNLNGLVEVVIDSDYNITAKGFKPSAGAQTQRLIFQDHPQYDCIVHFHCPLKEGVEFPSAKQWAYECGSVECGINTSKGLDYFNNGSLAAVMLEKHGPNLVFHHDASAREVINFIEAHFDLSKKTGGYDPELAK